MKKCIKTINFHNIKSQTIEFNKEVTFIYGSNGTGKTTLSIELQKQNDNDFHFFAFNEKYIMKKIFFFDKEKITTNQKINQEKAKFFVTEELLSLGKLIKKISNLKYDGPSFETIFSEWKENQKYKPLLEISDRSKIISLWKKECLEVEKIFKDNVIKNKRILNYKNYNTETYF